MPIHAYLYQFDGSVLDVSLKEGATLLDLKRAIPYACVWQVRVFPFELSDNDEENRALSDEVIIQPEQLFRSFITSSDTRVIYLTKGKNPYHGVNNELFVSMLRVRCLESGEDRPMEVKEAITEDTEFYLDDASFAEWNLPTEYDTVGAFLRALLKMAYKGRVENDLPRNEVYRAHMRGESG